MKLLKSLFVLLLLAGFYAPSYAAVSDVELVSCGVFNDENSNGDDKKEGGKKKAIKKRGKSLIASNLIFNEGVDR